MSVLLQLLILNESQSDEDILGTRIVIHSGKVIEKKKYLQSAL